MSLPLTDGDENAFCGARLQACRVDSRVDVLRLEVQREINALPRIFDGAVRPRCCLAIRTVRPRASSAP
jgi:hypothetical protein